MPSRTRGSGERAGALSVGRAPRRPPIGHCGRPYPASTPRNHNPAIRSAKSGGRPPFECSSLNMTTADGARIVLEAEATPDRVGVAVLDG